MTRPSKKRPPRTTFETFKDMQQELRLELQKRDEIDYRIARLRQGVIRLSAVCADSDDAPSQKEVSQAIEDGRRLLQLSNKTLGFTDACREVLRANKGWLTPRDVRSALIEMDIDLSGKSNPLASIHTTLKRLVKAGEVAVLPTSTGSVYMWRRITER